MHFLNSKINYEGKLVTNIFHKYVFISSNEGKVKEYFDTDIEEGETPESLSYKHYGTTDYWWIVLIFNNIIDPFYDWLLSREAMEDIAQRETGGNQPAYNDMLVELEQRNEERRTIKMLTKEGLDQVLENMNL